jgi:hypothetical protein
VVVVLVSNTSARSAPRSYASECASCVFPVPGSPVSRSGCPSASATFTASRSPGSGRYAVGSSSRPHGVNGGGGAGVFTVRPPWYTCQLIAQSSS